MLFICGDFQRLLLDMLYSGEVNTWYMLLSFVFSFMGGLVLDYLGSELAFATSSFALFCLFMDDVLHLEVSATPS